jgi:hypothetical protein
MNKVTKFTKVQNGKGPEFVFKLEWKPINQIDKSSKRVFHVGENTEDIATAALEITFSKKCDWDEKDFSGTIKLSNVNVNDDNTLSVFLQWDVMSEIHKTADFGPKITELFCNKISKYVDTMCDEIDVHFENYLFENTFQLYDVDNKSISTFGKAMKEYEFTNKFGNINLQ